MLDDKKIKTIACSFIPTNLVNNCGFHITLGVRQYAFPVCIKSKREIDQP